MRKRLSMGGYHFKSNTCFSRRAFLNGALGAGIANLVLPFAGSCQTAEKPNIVIMFLDNIGYGDLGCFGNQQTKTPRIDRLAAEGVRCTDFYIASPSCMPSRGALLTGRHPLRNGLNEQLWKVMSLNRSPSHIARSSCPVTSRGLGTPAAVSANGTSASPRGAGRRIAASMNTSATSPETAIITRTFTAAATTCTATPIRQRPKATAPLFLPMPRASSSNETRIGRSSATFPLTPRISQIPATSRPARRLCGRPRTRPLHGMAIRRKRSTSGSATALCSRRLMNTSGGKKRPPADAKTCRVSGPLNNSAAYSPSGGSGTSGPT